MTKGIKYIYKPSSKKLGFWQPIVKGNYILECAFYFQNKTIKIPKIDLSELNDGDRLFIDLDQEKIIIADKDTSLLYKIKSNSFSYIGPLIIAENNTIYIIKHLSII